ncbi:MAG: glucose 1-dehydrogenase [Alphaproteobacteria bacterium]|nr:glucose 1-dehydrogenase [Alphaproteobacteria bacterium]
MSGRLQGKVALITGGTSGMGRGTVELFLAEGAKVVVADILDEKGTQMERDFGPDLAYHHTDVAVEAHVKGAVDLAVKKYGRLDCIFNNAGMGGVSGEIQSIDMAGFDKAIDVLVKGVVLGMKYAAPVMKAQKSGSIISTASVAGLSGGFGPHIYSACKAAVIQLSKSVALELGKYNIRVNAICPGGIATSIFGRGLGLPSQLADESAKKMEEVLVDFQPIRRAGLPSDIAKMALFLASDDSTFVSGQAIAVDGGLMAGRERGQGAGRIADGMTKVFRDLMKT